MALTATDTQGFEFERYVEKDEVLWVPGDPGDTFDEGDSVTFTAAEGLADPAAADEQPYGIVDKKVIVSSATAAGFPKLGQGGTRGWGEVLDAVTKTLVAIKPLVRVGAPVFKCTFANQHDDTVAAYSSSTPSITLTTSPGADDDTNGALIYVYDGTGAGQWNIGADYAHGTKVLTLHRKFETDLSTDSKVIILEGEGSNVGGIGWFGRMTLSAAGKLTVDNGYDDGDWMIYADARSITSYLKNLTLPVIPAGALLT